MVRGCDPHHPLPRRVGSVQWVRVFPAGHPAGWAAAAVTGAPGPWREGILTWFLGAVSSPAEDSPLPCPFLKQRALSCHMCLVKPDPDAHPCLRVTNVPLGEGAQPTLEGPHPLGPTRGVKDQRPELQEDTRLGHPGRGLCWSRRRLSTKQHSWGRTCCV